MLTVCDTPQARHLFGERAKGAISGWGTKFQLVPVEEGTVRIVCEAFQDGDIVLNERTGKRFRYTDGGWMPA